jgi:NitT/TauT family transport system ATP-binding protein
MADYFDIELPSPRTLDVKTTEQFGTYTKRIYHLLGMD